MMACGSVIRRDVAWRVDEPESAKNFWTTHWTANWEDATLDIVERFCRPDATFVDIGAWIGPISMWAARRGPVLAIEPDPVAVKYLKINRDANGFSFPIIHGAITPQTGPAYVMPHESGWGSSMTTLSEAGTEVLGWTLPALLTQQEIASISLVKMDVEGAETLLLPHIAPFLSKRGVPLLIEVHEAWWQQAYDPEWLSGYENIEGSMEGFSQVLCYGCLAEVAR